MAVAFRSGLAWRGMDIGSVSVCVLRAFEVYTQSLSCSLTLRDFTRLTVCLLPVNYAMETRCDGPMPTQHLTPHELQAKLDALPRIELAHTPTPLEELTRLRSELGGDSAPRIFVKREDLTGLGMGGNKVRHYEFEMPHIVDGGYDTLINIMDYHSNNARLTAAAANKVGLRYVLVLKNAAHRKVQGNLLIDKLLGAELHLLDQFQSETAQQYAADLKRRLEEDEGCKVYLLQEHLFPRIVGMVGYVRAGLELMAQIEELGLSNVHVYAVAGRSLCGLMLAANNLGLDWEFRCHRQLRHAAG